MLMAYDNKNIRGDSHSHYYVVRNVNATSDMEAAKSAAKRFVERRMGVLWLRSSSLYFGELTFRALTLRLACQLRPDLTLAPTICLTNVLESIVRISPALSRDLSRVCLRAGALREIDGVRSFPFMFNDVYSGQDEVLGVHMCRAANSSMSTAVRSEFGDAGQRILSISYNFSDAIFTADTRRIFSSHAGGGNAKAAKSVGSVSAVKEALSQGDHFCFRPSNPDNHGEDSAIFLRVDSPSCEWVVLLPQKKQQSGKSVVDCVRRSTEHLFRALKDASGTQHTFTYVRALVTVDGVESSMGAQSPTETPLRHDDGDARATMQRAH